MERRFTMDKQFWFNRCTGYLSSFITLWRGGSPWTKEFGVTNERVTSLAQWLFGKEAHTGQTNDSLPPPDKLQHKKWISSQGLGYFAILATYSPREKILSLQNVVLWTF
jgi:hypothetical protein